MSFEGLCPYWQGESRDYKYMRCDLCLFNFTDPQTRRRMAFEYCAKEYEKCTIYKVLSEREGMKE